MKTKHKTTAYIIHSIAAAMVLLTAQVSLAGSATWLLSPQDSAWENANNWTPGGPPNGPSDIATFDRSSQTGVNISTSEEVNSVVFTSDSASFDFSILACDVNSCGEGKLIISGIGINNNSGVGQTFEAANLGQIIFNNASTAASAHMSIVNHGAGPIDTQFLPGYTIFNDTSNAAGASIFNEASAGDLLGGEEPGATIFNGTSTAGHATITNGGGGFYHAIGGSTTFNDLSTADSATLVAGGGFPLTGSAAIVFNGASSAGNATIIANGVGGGIGGAIVFNDASTGGTAWVKVFENGHLDIGDHQSGVTVGSIEGSGNVFLGANTLTVGTNGINTSFSGVISGSGSLTKVGGGVLTLQANDCIADTVGLILVSSSLIKLDFTGPPDVIASLKVNGVEQPPGIYGSPTSGAPHQLSQFAGAGTVQVGTGAPVVISNPATAVAISSATLNGSLNPHGLTTIVYFQYGTTTSYGLTTPRQTQAGNTYRNISANISGLPANTAYHFRIVATNIASTTYGADRVFTLVPDDFNNDGHLDYLLFNSATRGTVIWYMNNNVHVTGTAGPTLPAGWNVVGAADFNRDGHPDCLLFNPTTRGTVIWYMNNNVHVTGNHGPTLPAGWSAVALADFNRDGFPDYLLLNANTRQTVIWYMNNNVHVSGNYGPTVPAGWSLVAVADFNRDGHRDYLLFNATTRGTVIWYMNNNVHVTGNYGPTLPAGWSLIGAADFDGNGRPDYLLYNSSSHQTVIWYMNNNVRSGSAYGPTLPSGWSLVAP